VKPVNFDYARPGEVSAALKLIADQSMTVKLVAGSQSLGPMLNMRLVQPDLLVDITGIEELREFDERPDEIILGACITHADMEDVRVPDVTRGALPFVARGIAYRAVRNRGTIGGSLAHADPAADWLCTLTALGATVLTWRAGGGRAIPLAAFLPAAFRTALEPGEIVEAVRIPRPSEGARWGYYKACRKPGEFAFAMAAVLVDAARGIRRAAIGAVGGPPVLLEGARAVPEAVEAALAGSGLDAVERRQQAVALKRALAQAAV
jgi:aerobic carbon-monoxide dehydrogenase medium subunit